MSDILPVHEDDREKYTACVAAGAALLDEYHPGWERLVFLDKLDMSSLEDCIVGQIYGSWGEGSDALGGDWDMWNMAAYGFERLLIDDTSSSNRRATDHYQCLGGEWISLILDRREKASLAASEA